MIERHGNHYAAKFAREQKDRPTDWLVNPEGDLRHLPTRTASNAREK